MSLNEVHYLSGKNYVYKDQLIKMRVNEIYPDQGVYQELNKIGLLAAKPQTYHCKMHNGKPNHMTELHTILLVLS